jgi:bifunctional DNA-binding transcriptional regulator/antitoxin component of YhaV-PrlF toxin-antitoxin module
LREKLGLKPGQVFVFDEDAMRSVVGCAEGTLSLTAAEWLDETRGHSESKG